MPDADKVGFFFPGLADDREDIFFDLILSLSVVKGQRLTSKQKLSSEGVWLREVPGQEEAANKGTSSNKLNMQKCLLLRLF